MKAFLDSLSVVATSWLALIGYVVLASVLALRTYRTGRPQWAAKDILGRFDGDKERRDALRILMGAEPPRGLTGSDAILAWVRSEANVKTSGLLVLCYVATLVVVLVLVALALLRSTSGAGTVQSQQFTSYLRFVSVSDDACAALPPSTFLAAAHDAQLDRTAVVNTCEAAVTWSGIVGAQKQFTLSLEGAGAFQLAEPNHVYWLKANDRIDVAVGLPNEARVKILLLPYVAADAESASKRELLRGMLDEKVRELAERVSPQIPSQR